MSNFSTGEVNLFHVYTRLPSFLVYVEKIGGPGSEAIPIS